MLGQFAYNNSRNYSTGISLNLVLFGSEYTIRMKFVDKLLEGVPTITLAKDRVRVLEEIREGIVEKLADS